MEQSDSIIKELLQREADAVLNIPITNDFYKVVDIIEKRVHGLHGKIVISGMGKAGQIGHNIATTFSSTGSPAVFLHPSEAQHGDLGIVQPNDVMLLISNSGKTREIVELVYLTDNLYPGIPKIVITANPDSDLGKSSDVCIATGNPTELCPLGLTPSTSTTVMTVIGDILVNLTMVRVGFDNKEYAKRHHGGYLGTLSREQSKSDNITNK